MLNWKFLALAAVAPLTLATAAQAQVNTQARTAEGVRGELAWKAQSRVIAMTPTSDFASPNVGGGGNPLFFPSGTKSGTVALIMEYEGGARFICSGSLVGKRSIVTAGHCVSDGAGTANPIKTTAYFYNGEPNDRTPFNPEVTAIDVTRYYVNSGYTGEVIDQNDIAVLRLASDAPDSAQIYKLFTEADLTGVGFNVAGYGGRSTIGGSFGTNAGTGFLREGDNIYDYAWGNDLFQGFFTDLDGNGENFFGTAEIQFSYVSDFDSGLAVNDASRRIANALGLGPIGDAFFADTGVGAREVGIAGGDSGGPGFVDGKLASVNSYGLSFGVNFGDCRAGLNSSCGEFSGYVPIYIHTDFIKGAIPEPATWAMMIAGFGMVGSAMRRRRQTTVSA